MPGDGPFARLLSKFESQYDLSGREEDAIASLPHNLRSYPANTDILREGDRPSQSCFIVEGFLCRFKFVRDGQRQILSLHIPGDVPDLQSVYLAHTDYYLGSLTPAVLAFIPHASLLEVIARHPRLAAGLWRETLIDAAIFREWIINIGRRPAFGRLAHVFCELVTRLEQVGLADQTGFPWFLTQVGLGDATGLSVMHINRTMQTMRANGLLGPLNNKRMDILDWHGLVSAADFKEDYLHLRNDYLRGA